MAPIHHGSCLCSHVRFEIVGALDQFMLCHCKRCQKNTGSAHAANLFSAVAELRWIQGQDVVRTFCLPRTRHARSFCTVCGSALPCLQMAGKLLVVPAGCLDTALTTPPTAHIFHAHRATWEDQLPNTPKHDELPE